MQKVKAANSKVQKVKAANSRVQKIKAANSRVQKVKAARMWLWLNLLPLYNVTSRNVSSISFSSYVNLMVLWIWLILVMYVVNSDVEPVHMMKLSSMNRFHSNMFGLPSFFYFSSNLPI